MGVPVAVGVIVGVVASFVQSLGLTIQRMSHLANERLVTPDRKPDWQRPLWLAGLAIFLVANVAGTLFQIGTLPIIVLGPLGAVSLVCNALFAHLLLGDAFSVQLALGSALIATGATLVGIFGSVPEPTHTLPELVDLYQRPRFLAWLAALALALATLLATAHLAQWRLARRVADLVLPPGTPPPLSRRRYTRAQRTQSLPAAATTAGRPSEREPLLPHAPPAQDRQQRHHHSASKRFSDRIDPPPALHLPSPHAQSTTPASVDDALASTRLWLALAFGATSGTLSGLCLLFTKTGMDLVIQTLVNRNNQFGHLEAWALLLVLLVCELAQLSYLNRALRLVGPTLVCPTAFCFYNATSILSGLIFYRQFDALGPLQASLIGLGSAVLLGGVWIVSVKPVPRPSAAARGADGGVTGKKRGRKDKIGAGNGERDAGSGMSMDEMGDDDGDDNDVASEDDDEDSDDGLIPYRPRGFSIGISAASPGFEIRPSGPRRNRLSLDGTTTLCDRQYELGSSTSSLPGYTAATTVTTAVGSLRGSDPGCPGDQDRRLDSPPFKSPPADGSHRLVARRNRRGHHHHHCRDDSLTGTPYVGLLPPPHSYLVDIPAAGASPCSGDNQEEEEEDDGLGAAPEGNFALLADGDRGRRRRSWWWHRWPAFRGTSPPPPPPS
ncbi:hypothetical protein JCM3774_005146 [Rhodotorula dairenensis]